MALKKDCFGSTFVIWIGELLQRRWSGSDFRLLYESQQCLFGHRCVSTLSLARIGMIGLEPIVQDRMRLYVRP